MRSSDKSNASCFHIRCFSRAQLRPSLNTLGSGGKGPAGNFSLLRSYFASCLLDRLLAEGGSAFFGSIFSTFSKDLRQHHRARGHVARYYNRLSIAKRDLNQ